MNLKKDRKVFRTISQRMRRARRLYVFMMRERLRVYGNEAMDFVAERMQQRGLYSEKTNIRAVRQSIQGHMYRIDTGKYQCGDSWHEWCFKNGQSPYTGYSKPIMQKRA